VSQQSEYSDGNGHVYSFSSNSFDGTTGVTLFPGASIDSSPDNNIYAIISASMNDFEKSMTLAHELYGHAYLYELKQLGYPVEFNHQYVNTIIDKEWVDELSTYIFVSGRKETNTILLNQILLSQYESFYHWR